MGVYLAKPKTEKVTEEGGDLSQTLSAFGVASMQGWRQTMEDAHIAVPSLQRWCPTAVEALRALEQAQKKEVAGGGAEPTAGSKEEGSASSGTGAVTEEKEKQQSKKRSAVSKKVEADQEVRSSCGDHASEQARQSTTQQAESKPAEGGQQSPECEVPEDISLYAVFDGHASNAVSCWVSDNYVKIFAECLRRVQREAAQGRMPEGLAAGSPEAASIFNLRNAAICEALQQSFLEVDEQMQKEENRQALKKYYEEGQVEQKDEETYIQKYLNDGGDVRLVEMEGQKFLQFVPKTNDDEDDSTSKDSDEHGGERSTSPVAISSPVVEDLDAQESSEQPAATGEASTSTAGKQELQKDGGIARGEEKEKEKEVEISGEKMPPLTSASTVSCKQGDSGAPKTLESGNGSAGAAADSAMTTRKEESKERTAAEELAESAVATARHVTRFNSTADVTTLGGDAAGARAAAAASSKDTEENQQSKLGGVKAEEEKKRPAEQKTAGEEDIDMEDAQTLEEGSERGENKRERRRRKDDQDKEGEKADREESDRESSAGGTAAGETKSFARDEKQRSEDDDSARADSRDEDEDDDVFGRREGGDSGERTPLFAHPSTPEGSGATAVVVLVVGGPEPVVVTANAGDSRGVICRGGQAFPLSHDHKPTNPDEKARIFAAGGSVTNGRVDGNLNLSRAVGDLFYKQNREVPAKAQRITAFPDVRITRICEDDEFLTLACDGIWDCKTNQEAVDFVRERLQRAGRRDAATLRRICEELCDDCLAEDPLQSEGHGCDNMTCLVVELSSHVKQHRPQALGKEEKIVLYGGGDDKYLGCEEKQFESDENDD